MWPIATAQRRNRELTRRGWDWLRSHPSIAFALLAGTLAFLRVIAISHGRLGTARVLLDRADLVGLAGGLMMSAALLWLPLVAASVTFVLLGRRQGDRWAVQFFVAAFVLLVGGIFAMVRWGDIDLDLVAQAGPRYVWFVIGLGAVFGGALHFVLRLASYSSSTVDARKSVGSDESETPDSSGLAATGPDEPKPDGDCGSGDQLAHDTLPTTPTATRPERWARLERGVELISSVGGRIVAGLFALAGALFLISLVLFILLGLWRIVSEPSEPPENITVATRGIVETRTVHVLDDGGPEFTIMSRDDRRILTVADDDVRDRYTCRTVAISRTITRDVNASVFRGVASRDRPLDIVARSTNDDVQGRLADEWVEAVLASPPPCSPQWTADELATVRAELGHECHELTGCMQQFDVAFKEWLADEHADVHDQVVWLDPIGRDGVRREDQELVERFYDEFRAQDDVDHPVAPQSPSSP